MKIINASYEIITDLNGPFILQTIEECGRVCYQSKYMNDEHTYEQIKAFVGTLIKRGHESVLEHYSFSVRFICDRGISHEIVRHRLASYSQESQRYCNYAKEIFASEVMFIAPPILKGSREWNIWWEACKYAEEFYLRLINEQGVKPEIARAVLPNSTKTELVMTANIREWRHFLKLRTAPSAHPQMKELTIPLLNELKENIPIVFDDINQ